MPSEKKSENGAYGESSSRSKSKKSSKDKEDANEAEERSKKSSSERRDHEDRKHRSKKHVEITENEEAEQRHKSKSHRQKDEESGHRERSHHRSKVRDDAEETDEKPRKSHHRSKARDDTEEIEEKPRKSHHRSKEHGDKERSRHEEQDEKPRKSHRKKEVEDEDAEQSVRHKERGHHRSKEEENDREARHRRSKNHEGDGKEEGRSHKSHKSKKKDENRENDDDEDRKSRHHRKRDEEENEGSRHRKSESLREERHERSSRPTERGQPDEDIRDRMDRSLHRYESAKVRAPHATEASKGETNYDYDEDFDDDFEDESDEEKPEVKKSSKMYYSSDEEVARRNSYNDDRRTSLGTKDYEYDDYMRGRVMKANAHISVPTELVEVHSSKIYFNHDSRDRQARRAADLLKTIELDKKTFNLLDINPEEMRTVYSSHLKHEKVQTNDDVVEIEIQTDDIDYVTRWTQFPPEDLKGYGTETQNNYDAYEEDLFGKFRLEVNFLNMLSFLEKAAPVVEAILKENNNDSSSLQLDNSSDLEFSKGFSRLMLPKFLNKVARNSVLSNCTFCQDDPNFVVSTYDLFTDNSPDRFTSSLLVVWNIKDPEKPYKALVCESKSNCLSYTSFMVFSGNMDGSISVWDLREPFNLHLANSKKKAFSSEESVMRSPTYSTAGVLLNENHFSEVKAIVPLQNKTRSNEKGVFLQLATLELESKLIIWTVVELNHVDLAGFETDLGLLPGGRIKLVKSSQIDLRNFISPFGKDRFQTLSMACPINQTNNFYISTNMGRIIHVHRESDSSSITTMKSEFDDDSMEVTTLEFHHELQDILLAGYGNGDLRLYHTKYTLPIKTWHFGCQGNKVKEIHWVTSKSSSFIIIDDLDNLYIWDLLADDTGPIFSKQISGFGKIAISSQKQIDDPSNDSKNVAFAMIGQDSRELEIHLFNPDWAKKHDKETKKFSKLLKNVLLTF